MGLLDRLDNDVTAVVVVGHNPAMEALADSLVGSADPEVRRRVEELGFSTAAVAVLAYDGSWAGLAPRTCRLEGFSVGRG